MLRLLNAFPQKRKCYFYPQCMPLSCDAVGLDSYRDCPTINILSGVLNTHTAHTQIQKTCDGKVGRTTNLFFLLNLISVVFTLLCFSVEEQCRNFSPHTVGRHSQEFCQTLCFLFVHYFHSSRRSESCGSTHPSCEKGHLKKSYSSFFIVLIIQLCHHDGMHI